MRIEFIIFVLTAFGIAHIYTEGKYIKQIMQYKKYFKMIGVAFAGLFLYYVLKKVSPDKQREMLSMSNEYIKYLPLDSNTSSFISPILDFTKNNYWAGGAAGAAGAAAAGGGIEIGGPSHPTLPLGGGRSGRRGGGGGGLGMSADAEIGGSGGGIVNRVKRSVSNVKKKYIASQQGWRCKSCNNLLDFGYEIDHVKPLWGGGDNSVGNLQALCTTCHKTKTMMDYL